MVSSARLRVINTAPSNPDGEYVLYYMTAFRRHRYNFALDRAVELAEDFRKPLVILEPIQLNYRWACVRHHRFVLEGMRDRARALQAMPVDYYPFVERERGGMLGLLEAVAAQAVCLVTDDYPTFHGPRILEQCATLPVRVEGVDHNGLLPLRTAPKGFPSAYAFRRFVHATIAEAGLDRPSVDPLGGVRLPEGDVAGAIRERWPPVSPAEFDDVSGLVRALPLDATIGAGWVTGGSTEAREHLDDFINHRLAAYDERRNAPDDDWSSRLSPYLHFGHISAHEVLDQLLAGTDWTPASIDTSARGGRPGWGLDASRTAFIDQIVTWRELGFNTCLHLPQYDEYASLPDWARATLTDHASDPRQWTYELEELESASTHDALWNAAQQQLVVEGRIHNYLRMLWGKKILEWSPSPEEAADVMIELNNAYALDGRDPNSYSGIFWTLGRYDRPWGPERPIFGKVRYMSSDNTRRKTSVTAYLERYGPGGNL